MILLLKHVAIYLIFFIILLFNNYCWVPSYRAEKFTVVFAGSLIIFIPLEIVGWLLWFILMY